MAISNSFPKFSLVVVGMYCSTLTVKIFIVEMQETKMT